MSKKNRNNDENSVKKPFYQRKWFIVIVAIVLIGAVGNLFGGGDSSGSDGTTTASSEKSAEVVSSESTSDTEWEGDNLTLQKLNNDKTEHWRVAVISSSKPQDQYAFEYYQRYMKGHEDEFNNLFIVNLTLKTTTQIFVGSSIDVSVHEYVDGEEYDAIKLNSGMDLEQYQILDKETGKSLY